MKFALDFQPKLFATLRNYDRRKFSADLMAGIIVGIVALPLAIAFGIASGVTPEKGLITAIIGGFIVSLLGGSSVQIGGPTGAFIVIVAGIIGRYGLEGLAIATIMAGIMLVLLGVLKLGVVIKFIPYPIIVGFTAGIALTIFSTQIKDLFGLQIAGPIPDDFISKWGVYFQHFDTTNLWALGIGLVSIAIILLSALAAYMLIHSQITYNKKLKQEKKSSLAQQLVANKDKEEALVLLRQFSREEFTKVLEWSAELPKLYTLVLKLEKDGEYTEDDVKQAEKDMQKVTDKAVEDIDKMCEAKTKDIMTI